MAVDVGHLAARYTLDPSGHSRGAREIVRNTEKMAGASRRLNNEVRASSGSMRRLQFAGQQLAFGIEDASTQFGTQGLAGAVRAGSNNLTQMFSIIDPRIGMIASLAAGVGTLALSLNKQADAANRAAEAEQNLAERQAERQKLVDRAAQNRRVVENIDRNVAEGKPDPIRDDFTENRRQIRQTRTEIDQLQGDIRKRFADSLRDLRVAPFLERTRRRVEQFYRDIGLDGFADRLVNAEEMVKRFLPGDDTPALVRQLRMREDLIRLNETDLTKLQELVRVEDNLFRLRLESLTVAGRADRARLNADQIRLATDRAMEIRNELQLQSRAPAVDLLDELKSRRQILNQDDQVLKTRQKIGDAQRELNDLTSRQVELQKGISEAEINERKIRREEADRKLAAEISKIEIGIRDSALNRFDAAMRTFDRQSEQRFRVLEQAAQAGQLSQDRLAELQKLEAEARRQAERQADPKGQERIERGMVRLAAALSVRDPLGVMAAAARIGDAVANSSRAEKKTDRSANRPASNPATDIRNFDFGALQRAMMPDDDAKVQQRQLATQEQIRDAIRDQSKDRPAARGGRFDEDGTFQRAGQSPDEIRSLRDRQLAEERARLKEFHSQREARSKAFRDQQRDAHDQRRTRQRAVIEENRARQDAERQRAEQLKKVMPDGTPRLIVPDDRGIDVERARIDSQREQTIERFQQQANPNDTRFREIGRLIEQNTRDLSALAQRRKDLESQKPGGPVADSLRRREIESIRADRDRLRSQRSELEVERRSIDRTPVNIFAGLKDSVGENFRMFGDQERSRELTPDIFRDVRDTIGEEFRMFGEQERERERLNSGSGSMGTKQTDGPTQAGQNKMNDKLDELARILRDIRRVSEDQPERVVIG